MKKTRIRKRWKVTRIYSVRDKVFRDHWERWKVRSFAERAVVIGMIDSLCGGDISERGDWR